MSDCIFCQIIAGDIPASKVYEDDQILAFLDITQVTPGHTLVIPKEHCRNLLDMPEKTASQLFAKVPTIARALTKITGASAINLINNSGEEAGQTVFHAHIHLLPRTCDDQDGLKIQFATKEPIFEHLASLANSIREVVE